MSAAPIIVATVSYTYLGCREHGYMVSTHPSRREVRKTLAHVGCTKIKIVDMPERYRGLTRDEFDRQVREEAEAFDRLLAGP